MIPGRPTVFAPLAAALLLSACAGPEAFREPESGPVAKIRIKNAHPEAYYITVRVGDPGPCTVGSHLGFLNGGREIDTRRVGMLDAEPVREGLIERRIPAGQPITFVPQVIANLDWITILTIQGKSEASRDRAREAQASACATPAFVPRDGEEYELVYDAAPGQCKVSLSRLSQGSDGKVVRSEIGEQAQRWMSPVLGSYLLGVPSVSCRDR